MPRARVPELIGAAFVPVGEILGLTPRPGRIMTLSSSSLAASFRLLGPEPD